MDIEELIHKHQDILSQIVDIAVESKMDNADLRGILVQSCLEDARKTRELEKLRTDNQILRTLLVEIRRCSDVTYPEYKDVHAGVILSKINILAERATIAKEKNIKKAAVLRNWVWMQDHLYGKVYNHPDFEDGEPVHTSKVISMNEAKTLAETKNTIYTLECPA